MATQMISNAELTAMEMGFTRRCFIEGGCEGGKFLVRPDDDHDGAFRAWAVDWDEWTTVNGSNVLMEWID